MLLDFLAAGSLALFSSHLGVPLPYRKYCIPTVVMLASAASSVIPGWDGGKHFSCLSPWPPDAQSFSSDISKRILLTVLPSPNLYSVFP